MSRFTRHLQRRGEPILRDIHPPELAHLLPGLLLVEELGFAGDVAAVAFRGDILEGGL